MLCAKFLQLYLTLCDPLDQTIACQSPLSMGFLRQEYWSGLPRPPPGDLPDPGIKPTSPTLQVDSLPLSHQGSPLTIVLGTENTEKNGTAFSAFYNSAEVDK